MDVDWSNVGCNCYIGITIRIDELTLGNKKFYNELSFVFNYSNYKLISVCSHSLYNFNLACKL